MDFTHYGDATVHLATDLVNTFDPIDGRDVLTTPAALAAFLAEHGDEVPAARAGITDDDLRQVVAHRATLRAAFAAPTAAQAADRLNDLLVTSRAVPRISVHAEGAGEEGSPPHLHFETRAKDVASWLGAVCGMAMAVMLCDHGKERFGLCASPSCEDAFVDTSKNRRKRYCSDACATRESVAAFRARQRQQRH